MPADPFTPAELETGAQAIRDANDHEAWDATYPLVPADRFAAAALSAVTLMIERRAQVPLLSLIEDLTDDGPCHYDHHGYCQGHSLDPKPCPHERAKRVLAKAHAYRAGGDDA